MEYKNITDLNDIEIMFIVNEVYKPEKITKIIRKIKKKEVIVTVKTQWHTTDDNGKDIYYLDSETLTLRDPFATEDGFGYDPNTYSFNSSEEQEKFKKYCLAKGVCYLLQNNPYLKEVIKNNEQH